MSRAVSWSKGPNHLFYGIELPLFGGLTLLAEKDSVADVANAGIRWVFAGKFCLYDYLMDVSRKGSTFTKRQNIVGVCYQNRF
ncbi:MAG: hypothetical protein HY815_03430 [Candidatus Riflebacteria bacterium]|nr:hypothetical protein [Candidatus Riflebacteria bacterium]